MQYASLRVIWWFLVLSMCTRHACMTLRLTWDGKCYTETNTLLFSSQRLKHALHFVTCTRSPIAMRAPRRRNNIRTTSTHPSTEFQFAWDPADLITSSLFYFCLFLFLYWFAASDLPFIKKKKYAKTVRLRYMLLLYISLFMSLVQVYAVYNITHTRINW